LKLIVKSTFLILVVIAVSFSSCTSYKQMVYLQNIDSSSTENFFPKVRPDYKIQAQDILFIRVLTLNQDVSDLINSTPTNTSNLYNNEASMYIFGYNVSDSGYVELPVLGKVYVAGETLDGAKEALSKRAAVYLKDATIVVKLISFKYSVFGEVLRPGVFYNYNNQLTVLEAISEAGNLTDYANRKKVLVIRPTSKGTRTFRLDLTKKNILSSDGFYLLPNDMVYVEPIKSKTFRLNMPTVSLFLTSVSTLILILNYLNK
jgi:polysaccharide biosynthesis/export protein